MRPFPWKCGTCGKREVKPVVVDYTTDREHDGRAYSLQIPDLEILECAACQTRQLTDYARDEVENALREKAGLLKPKEIRASRNALGLTQEQFANSLRVAKETVSRWETGGQIQQRAMDLLLRVFFGIPQVRIALMDQSTLADLGAKVLGIGGVSLPIPMNLDAEGIALLQEFNALDAATGAALSFAPDQFPETTEQTFTLASGAPEESPVLPRNRLSRFVLSS